MKKINFPNKLKIKKIRNFVLFGLILFFIFALFHIIYSYKITRRMSGSSLVISAKADKYTNKIPLEIFYDVDQTHPYNGFDDEVDFLIFSNKKLDLEKLDINLKELGFDEAKELFEYSVSFSNLNTGENTFDLEIVDNSGNISSLEIKVEKKSKKTSDIPPFDNYKLTLNGDSLIALVSKKYKLPANYAPSDIVFLPDFGIPTTGGGHLRSIVVQDLSNMIDDMKNAGLDLKISSSYRSYDTQITTYKYWLSYNGGDYSKADKISARPGHSEHQLGTTIDVVNSEVNYKLTRNFGNTKAFAWLNENAYKYGFVMSYPEGKETITGYSYEPWHWRYIGKDHALEFKNSGLTLIEYLKLVNNENSN